MSSESVRERWHIKVMGNLEVISPGGAVVSATGKKAGELIAYLAINSHRAHSREKLIDLMWGDSEVSEPRTRLRQELAKLKSLVEAAEPSSSPLLVTNQDCRVQPDVWVDAVEFQRAIDVARHEPDHENRAVQFGNAVSLYRGDLLTLYNAPWILSERASLSQMYVDALLGLADSLRTLKQFSDAERVLVTLLEREPLSELGHSALMRVHAELGQPKRLQQQRLALERALQAHLGMRPTPAFLRLADTLYEEARQRASTLIEDSMPDSFVIGSTVLPDSGAPVRSRQDRPIPPPHDALAVLHRASTRYFVWSALGLLLAAASATTFLGWKLTHKTLQRVPKLSSKVDSRQAPKWVYMYEPRLGEKPNAEGRAIAFDATGIYVTGLIQTEKDDADILTLKLSPQGKLAWADRYSSPEHDCDRAFSITTDHEGGIYVGGETYVPATTKSTEGWRLVLLHYGSGGRRLWVRRSSAITHNEAHDVQVCNNMQGGCYIAGTSLIAGKRSALVMRYDSVGNMLWQRTVFKGYETVFSRFAVSPGGDVYLCGTAQQSRGDADVNTDWIVAHIEPSGQLDWTDTLDGAAHGTDSASRIAIDGGGNILVTGVLQTRTSSGAAGLQMALAKYSPQGVKLWQRLVDDSGPAVRVEGLAVNVESDAAIGGTQQLANGESRIVVARYDKFGNLAQSFRCQFPSSVRCAQLQELTLQRDEKVILAGQLASSTNGDMVDDSTSFLTVCSAEGHVDRQWLYASAPETTNVVRGGSFDRCPILTGQTGSIKGNHALMVLQY